MARITRMWTDYPAVPVDLNLNDPTVQAALIGASTAIVAGLIGGYVGGRAAISVARMNVLDASKARAEARQEARRARLIDATLDAAARLLEALDMHRIQLRDEAMWRHDPANDPWPVARKPRVDRIDTIPGLELQLTSPSRELAKRALELVASLVRMDADFAAAADRSRVSEGFVSPMDNAEFERFLEADGRHLEAFTLFVNEVRREVGAEPWADPDPRTPDGPDMTRGTPD